jgi:hypothetical protein
MARENPSPEQTRGMQAKRRKAEVGFLRAAAFLGIVGIGAAIGAILGSADVDAWVIGLVVALVSLIAAAVITRSIRA